VSAVAFDTLKFAQPLRDKAKFTPEQAEGLSEAFAQAFQTGIILGAVLALSRFIEPLSGGPCDRAYL
jgi:hypothetical protein